MELLQFKYFEIVAKHENMSKAAKELKIAQPAISQSIARLEKELEIKLFDRHGKKIRLNEYGRYLLKKIPCMLQPFDNIKLELADLSISSIQHIKLLVFSSSVFIPDLIAAYRKDHSDVEFTILHNLSETDYDVCISSAPFDNVDADSAILLDEEIALAVPLSSPLARYERLPLSAFNKESFISLQTGSALRSITNYFCEKVDFKPHIVFESNNPDIIRRLIEQGLGVAFYPVKTWGPLSLNHVKTVSIADIPFMRSIYAKVALGKYLSHTSKSFFQFAQEYYRNYCTPQL